jgi:hypothetical protein
LNVATLSIMTFGITTFGIMVPNILTLSINSTSLEDRYDTQHIFSIMTLSIMVLFAKHSINDTQHNNFLY